MQKTILSTADVARLFNVTETTVKRWANDGTLKCMKTPGGHRKFEMKNVVEFAQAMKFEPAGALTLTKEDSLAQQIQVAVLSRDFDALKKAFVHKALSPDKRDLFIFFSYLYQHRIHLWEIYDLIIGPGMTVIGERWANGALDVNHEHRASYETLEALAKLQTQILVKPPKSLSVICACPGGELHDIGLRCASYLFESEGWMSHYLGARTPNRSIISAVNELRPDAICLSITHESENKQETTELVDLLKSLRELNQHIFVGGRAICGNAHEVRPYASTYCSSLELLASVKSFEDKHIDESIKP